MSPNVPDTNASNDAASREPCPNCGYDLRATTVGARCPECGTKRITVARSQVQDLAREADAARDRLEDGWRLWARTLLISPLIVFGLMGSCLGPALLVAFAFVAPFRLIALRKMTPKDPYAQRLRSMEIDLARARKFAVIECGIAIAVVIIAILRSLPSAFISHEFYLGVALRDLAMRHLAQRASTCALDSATARRCIATSDELTRLDLVSLHDLDHAVLLDCKRDRRRSADAVRRISRARIVVLVPRRSLDVYRSGVESRARIARMRLPLRITALQRASNARFVLQCGQRIHPAALSITETARGRHAHSARGLNSSAAERVLRKINRATERCALVHGFFPLKRGI